MCTEQYDITVDDLNPTFCLPVKWPESVMKKTIIAMGTEVLKWLSYYQARVNTT